MKPIISRRLVLLLYLIENEMHKYAKKRKGVANIALTMIGAGWPVYREKSTGIRASGENIVIPSYCVFFLIKNNRL